ncbi:MFS transporter [Kitasatospora sp. NPDC056181]|uniref:MFS transporter n=1 Tax=Kitasatospora sp. NPDC056181 TaxID=3345737 RepID=UPI0035E126E1
MFTRHKATRRAPAPPAVSAPGVARLLRRPSLFGLWCGQALSRLGDQLFTVALIWSATASGSTTLLGALTLLETLPRLIILVAAGRSLDHLRPKYTLLFTCVAGALFAALPVIAPRRYELMALTVAAAAIAGASALYTPCFSKQLALLIDRDTEGPAKSVLFYTTSSLVQTVGPVLGGLLLGLCGAAPLYLLDAASFLVAALLFATLLPDGAGPSAVRAAHSRLRDPMHHVWRALWADRTLRWILTTALADKLLSFGPVMLGVPLLVHDHFQLTSAYYGVLMAASAWGMVLGNLILGRQSARRNLRHLMTLGYLATGIGELGVALSPDITAALLSTFALSTFIPFCVLPVMLALQERVPPHRMARSIATYTTLDLAAGVTSLALTAPLAHTVSAPALITSRRTGARQRHRWRPHERPRFRPGRAGARRRAGRQAH